MDDFKAIPITNDKLKTIRELLGEAGISLYALNHKVCVLTKFYELIEKSNVTKNPAFNPFMIALRKKSKELHDVLTKYYCDDVDINDNDINVNITRLLTASQLNTIKELDCILRNYF